MARSYYGDKLSDNMIVTPEGYLICQNVPIGRIGCMDYYGQELPAAYNEPTGKICKVCRSPEELFSEATMASFEGKPITNTHPTAMLDVNTAPMIERGHAQNIRREGDFLLADLFVKDAGLIAEIQNSFKREVSSGYDCSWHDIGDGKYEQREIIGNHVAIVKNGRAGSRVAIQDEKPKMEVKKNMKNITKSFLTALGFKHFAQDAEPEDIAKAMDAMKEDEPQKDPDKKEPDKKDVKDAEPDNQAQENAEFKKLADEIKALKDEIAEMKKGGAKKESADAVMDAVEKELDGEVKDEDPDEVAKKKEEEEKKSKDSKKSAADASLKKFVQDMKPIIMAIPDEKLRLETAKKFVSSVRDARTVGENGYANILNGVNANKKQAMDAATGVQESIGARAQKSVTSWNEAGNAMRGGKK